jgi:hypothetical protein
MDGTALIYGALGLVVAAAQALRTPDRVTAPRLVAWAVAWPFFAPWVLARPAAGPAPSRLEGARRALAPLERRLVEMDALLASPEFDPARVEAALAELRGRGVPDDDPRVQSVRARARNIARLRRMRETAGADIERALLRLEEMVGHLRLLRFTDGAGAAEVVALLDETAAVVRALGEAPWLA